MDFDSACKIFSRFSSGAITNKSDLNAAFKELSKSGDCCVYIELALRQGLLNYVEDASLTEVVQNLSSRSDDSALKTMSKLFENGLIDLIPQELLCQALEKIGQNKTYWAGVAISSAFSNGVIEKGYGFEVARPIEHPLGEVKGLCLGESGREKLLAIQLGNRIFAGPEPFETLRVSVANTPSLPERSRALSLSR